MKKKEKTDKKNVYCRGCKWVKKPFDIIIPIPEYNFVCKHPNKRIESTDAYSGTAYKPRLMEANPYNDCKYWESK